MGGLVTPKVRLHITKLAIQHTYQFLLDGSCGCLSPDQAYARKLIRGILKRIKVTVTTEHKHSCLLSGLRYCDQQDEAHGKYCECSCGQVRLAGFPRGSWGRLK